ncbi:MAG: DNA repair protein RadA [Rickettsiales bacterium]|nr:DNA repair protein RadA [Rickettsiales bacterium]
MTKNFRYLCQNCGSSYNKWQGQCIDCNKWNTIQVEEVEAGIESRQTQKGTAYKIENLSSVNSNPRQHIISNIEEFDRVAGGGLVPGSTILIGGSPGIGKSTLLLQVSNKLSQTKNCLYVTGEESIEQVKLHMQRLNPNKSKLHIVMGTNISNLTSTIESINMKLDLMIIDSIQTMFIPEIPSAPGTVSQVRTSAHELIALAKRKNFVLILIGHVTKDGQIAGPKVLEHMVDTVLYLDGESANDYRILRSVKNRFGNVNEIGVFEMSESGLKEVKNPSSLFLSERKANASGSVVFAGIEGTRPILVEVQGLVVPSNMIAPRRAVVGWELNRLSMILAVLSARYGLHLASHEVYLNIVGGLKIIEPAIDLAVICALISAFKNTVIENATVVFGEIGLLGEVRKVNKIEYRLKEATKLGFKNAIIPRNNKITKKQSGEMTITEISHIKELESIFLHPAHAKN